MELMTWSLGSFLAGAILMISVILVAVWFIPAEWLKNDEMPVPAVEGENPKVTPPAEIQRKLRIRENLLLSELGRIRRNLANFDKSSVEWHFWKTQETAVSAKLDEIQDLLEN